MNITKRGKARDVSPREIYEHWFASSLPQKYRVRLFFTTKDTCHRAHRECDKLRGTFLYLDYPISFINSSIKTFMCVTDNIYAPMPRLQVTTNYQGSTTIEDQPSLS